MTEAPLPADLEAFLNAQRVARLATVDEHSRPHIVPVCFAYTDGIVYIALDAKPKRVAVRELRRVRNLIANPHVQLLVDVWDEDWTRLAYLQLRGVASVIEPGRRASRGGASAAGSLRAVRSMQLEDAPVIRVAVESYIGVGCGLDELSGQAHDLDVVAVGLDHLGQALALALELAGDLDLAVADQAEAVDLREAGEGQHFRVVDDDVRRPQRRTGLRTKCGRWVVVDGPSGDSFYAHIPAGLGEAG